MFLFLLCCFVYLLPFSYNHPSVDQRYPEHFIFWKYKAEYYQKYKSEVQLDEKRIRKLDKIDLPELQEIKEAMQREKYAAYQEAMVEEYE